MVEFKGEVLGFYGVRSDKLGRFRILVGRYCFRNGGSLVIVLRDCFKFLGMRFLFLLFYI